MRLSLLLASTLLAATASAQITDVTLSATLDNRPVCYDQARQRLVFATSSREILEWDGAHWARQGVLLPAYATGALYDAARERVFFVVANQLVSYDGHGLVNHGLIPATRLVADTHRSRLVAVGVSNGMIAAHEWDGTSWQLVGTTPTSHVPVNAAYDEQRHVVVVQAAAFPFPMQTAIWEWDGTTWTLAAQGLTSRGALAYDPVNQTVIGVHSRTEAWNGSSWTVLSNTTPPSGYGAYAPDHTRGLVWTFSAPNARQYMFAWNGTGWSQQMPGPHPMPSANFTFDSTRNRAVLFSGDGTTALDEWDGFAWHVVNAAGGPTPRSLAGQAFDAARGETVLFGGSLPSGGSMLGETWAWNGASWRLAATTGPSARLRPSLAFDSARNRLVLVGGEQATTTTDHWEWDGVSWTQVSATTPMGQAVGWLGYDPVRARLVYADIVHRTWEHDGAQWTQVATGTPVPTGTHRSLVWHADRQRLQTHMVATVVVMRHEWDGVQWLPAPGLAGEIAYDTARDLMLCLQPSSPGLMTVNTAQAASALDHGTPCGGSTTTTSLTAFALPRPGEPAFHLDVRADARQQPALLGVGFGTTNVPIGNGCAVFVQNPIISQVWLTNANGFWHHPFVLPNNLALRGISFVAQGAVLDPASPGGLALTQALLLTIGD